MLYELALRTLENVSSEIALSFRQGFPQQIQLASIELEPMTLPIASSVLNVGSTAPSTIDIVVQIQESYLNQRWRQPYREDDFGSEFFKGTAWFPIADTQGPIVYSEGLMEVMLMDANVSYPSHKHAPEELYVILAGQVWRESDNKPGCWKYAGDVIHHRPHVVHSIKAGEEPALILNLWRGGGFEMPVITQA